MCLQLSVYILRIRCEIPVIAYIQRDCISARQLVRRKQTQGRCYRSFQNCTADKPHRHGSSFRRTNRAQQVAGRAGDFYAWISGRTGRCGE